jgi:hypothetical protein
MRVDKLVGSTTDISVIDEINAEIERMEEDGFDIRIISIKTKDTSDCYTTYEVWFEMREKDE